MPRKLSCFADQILNATLNNLSPIGLITFFRYGILLHKDQILSCCPNTTTELNLSTTGTSTIISAHIVCVTSLIYIYILDRCAAVNALCVQLEVSALQRSQLGTFVYARFQLQRISAGTWLNKLVALFSFLTQSDSRFFSQQAYISSFSLYPEVPESGADRNSELTLILMASSADPVVFKELLRGKKYIAQVLQSLCVILLFSVLGSR